MAVMDATASFMTLLAQVAPDVLALAADGRRRADVGARRHRRDVGGERDERARAAPRAARTGPTHTMTGTGASSICLDDVARRVERAARRVELDDHRRRAVRRGIAMPSRR